MLVIADFLSYSGFNFEEGIQIAKKMANDLNYRSLDSSGEWVDSDAGIALIHGRLSILDLSGVGNQPMSSILLL